MLRLLPLIIGLAVVLYPALVYVGLSRWGAQPLALVLIAVAALRWWVGHRLGRSPGKGPGEKDFWLVAIAALMAALTLATGSDAVLKAYPVMVNLLMFVLFAGSLRHPPSMIERFARLREPNLPPSGIAYTRQVTQVWCGFFAINGTLAAATLFASTEVWALYNGLIAYLLMSLLLAGEFCVRQRKRRDESADSALAIDD